MDLLKSWRLRLVLPLKVLVVAWQALRLRIMGVSLDDLAALLAEQRVGRVELPRASRAVVNSPTAASSTSIRARSSESQWVTSRSSGIWPRRGHLDPVGRHARIRTDLGPSAAPPHRRPGQRWRDRRVAGSATRRPDRRGPGSARRLEAVAHKALEARSDLRQVTPGQLSRTRVHFPRWRSRRSGALLPPGTKAVSG